MTYNKSDLKPRTQKLFDLMLFILVYAGSGLLVIGSVYWVVYWVIEDRIPYLKELIIKHCGG